MREISINEIRPLRIGQAENRAAGTGCTVFLSEKGMRAGLDVRGGLYARRVKMRAVGMGAKTRWYFWPNAAVREFAGLLAKHRDKQALILGGMALIYAAITLLAYR